MGNISYLQAWPQQLQSPSMQKLHSGGCWINLRLGMAASQDQTYEGTRRDQRCGQGRRAPEQVGLKDEEADDECAKNEGYAGMKGAGTADAEDDPKGRDHGYAPGDPLLDLGEPLQARQRK